MVVLADSRTAPPSERFEAFRADLDSALPPSSKLLELSEDAHGMLQAWTLGPSALLMRLNLAAEQAAMVQRLGPTSGSVPERVSVAVNTKGLAVSASRGEQHRGRALRLLDTSSDFQISFSGGSESVSYEIDTTMAGLDVDSVRRAFGRVEASPVHLLVRRHLLSTLGLVDNMDPASVMALGSATADLVRALVLSVSARQADRRQAAAETLRARIDHYVRAHLDDPNLTPSQIAGAHHVSLRYLYLVLSDTGRTPAEWIMQLRLARACTALQRGSVTVSSVAQRSGFKDHSHFTRRFKDAYGVTPTEFVGRVRAARTGT